MKSWKAVALGFVAGAATMVTTTAIAASGTSVEAIIPGDLTFRINEKNVAADSELPPINYKGYTYVPIRFLSEQLGWTVNYDFMTKQIIIKSPEPKVVEVEKKVIVEKPVYVDANEETGNKVYTSLPIKKSMPDYTVEVTGLSRQEGSTRVPTTKFFVTIENKKDSTKRIQLVPGSVEVEVDGKTYDAKKVDDTDDRWYNDIDPDDDYSGYIAVGQIPEEWERGTLKFIVRENGSTNTAEDTFEFNFKR